MDLVFDATKPDGTPRKLMDVAKLNSDRWRGKQHRPPMTDCHWTVIKLAQLNTSECRQPPWKISHPEVR